MILSHQHRFIFIKTAKTAGTSIEVFLSQHCGDKDVVTPIHPPVEPHVSRNHRSFWNPIPEMTAAAENGLQSVLAVPWRVAKRERFFNHMHARLLRLRVPRHIWEEYYTFCVERNPWDKTLSHYHMINDRRGGGLGFDQYLESRSFCLNYPRYTDRAGRIIVDRVVRYESLAEELGSVFDRLGIPFNGSLGVRAKSNHRSDRRPYQDVFTGRQRKIVEKAFAKEIELHGYSFDG